MAVLNPINGSEKVKDSFQKIENDDSAINTETENNAAQIQALVLGASNATIGAYPIAISGINTYTGTFATLTYFVGLLINMQGVTANTGAATVNLNGLGAKDIKIRLQDGTLRAASPNELHDEIQIIYDGTQFIVVDMGAKESERKIDNSYSLDLIKAYGETKIADDGQDVSLFTATGGILSQDTVNVKIGSGSIRITEATAGTSYNHASKNNISLDFLKFNNGEISDEDDYISFILYVSNINAVNQAQVIFSQDAIYSDLNIKYKLILSSGLVSGWNYLKIKKSTFANAGTGAWDNIQSMKLLWKSNAGFLGEYISFQLVQLVKNANDIPNPLASQGWNINVGEWFIGKEFDKLKLKLLSGIAGNTDSLIKQELYNNFKSTLTVASGGSNDAGYLVWHIDSINAIWGEINNNELRLTLYQAGVVTQFTDSLPINTDEKVTLILEKNGYNVILKGYTNNDLSTIKIIKTITTLNASGALSIGSRHTGLAIDYNSVSITEIAHAHHSDIAEVAKSLTERANLFGHAIATLSLPDNVATNLKIDTIDSGNGSIYMKSDNETAVITEAGIYLVETNYIIGTTTPLFISMKINGVSTKEKKRDATLAYSDYFTAQLKLKANDELQIIYKQSSGGAVNLYGTSSFSTIKHLSITRIS
jgi:hypothetical protein